MQHDNNGQLNLNTFCLKPDYAFKNLHLKESMPTQ